MRETFTIEIYEDQTGSSTYFNKVYSQAGKWNLLRHFRDELERSKGSDFYNRWTSGQRVFNIFDSADNKVEVIMMKPNRNGKIEMRAMWRKEASRDQKPQQILETNVPGKVAVCRSARQLAYKLMTDWKTLDKFMESHPSL